MHIIRNIDLCKCWADNILEDWRKLLSTVILAGSNAIKIIDPVGDKIMCKYSVSRSWHSQVMKDFINLLYVVIWLYCGTILGSIAWIENQWDLTKIGEHL